MGDCHEGMSKPRPSNIKSKLQKPTRSHPGSAQDAASLISSRTILAELELPVCPTSLKSNDPFSTPFQNDTNSEVEIDLDEVLDMESDPIRRDFLLSKLHGAKKSRQDVEEFVKELLTRAKTL